MINKKPTQKKQKNFKEEIGRIIVLWKSGMLSKKKFPLKWRREHSPHRILRLKVEVYFNQKGVSINFPNVFSGWGHGTNQHKEMREILHRVLLKRDFFGYKAVTYRGGVLYSNNISPRVRIFHVMKRDVLQTNIPFEDLRVAKENIEIVLAFADAILDYDPETFWTLF